MESCTWEPSTRLWVIARHMVSLLMCLVFRSCCVRMLGCQYSGYLWPVWNLGTSPLQNMQFVHRTYQQVGGSRRGAFGYNCSYACTATLDNGAGWCTYLPHPAQRCGREANSCMCRVLARPIACNPVQRL